jgi:hypothetical protein
LPRRVGFVPSLVIVKGGMEEEEEETKQLVANSRRSRR